MANAWSLICLEKRLRPVGPVHIAQPDDVVVGKLGDVVPALAGDADARDVELFTRRRGAVEAGHGTRTTWKPAVAMAIPLMNWRREMGCRDWFRGSA